MGERIHKPNGTQQDKVLQVLRDARGGWVSGRYFLQTLLLSQYHARIWELQKKGYGIEASSDNDEFGFKSYRLTKDQIDLTEIEKVSSNVREILTTEWRKTPEKEQKQTNTLF